MKSTALALAMLSVVPMQAMAQRHPAPTSITEKIEWTWADRPESPDPALPNVLLLGDSITRAYYPATAKELQGIANVYLFATSACSADPRYPEQLKDYFAMVGLRFRVVHFNNGMHGWKYTDEQYAASLPHTVKTLRRMQPEAKLLWANTTPIRSDSSETTNIRIDRRNADAEALMKRIAIPLDDQHALMQPHTDLHQDNVRWNGSGSELQAQQVAASVRQQLGK